MIAIIASSIKPFAMLDAVYFEGIEACLGNPMGKACILFHESNPVLDINNTTWDGRAEMLHKNHKNRG